MGFGIESDWPTGRIYVASTFSTLGTVAAPHPIFALRNPVGTRIIATVRELSITMDQTAAVATAAPIIDTGKINDLSIVASSAGTALTKLAVNGGTASDTRIVIAGDTATDDGASTALAGLGTTFWRTYIMRLHTAAGQVLTAPQSLLPTAAPVRIFNNQALTVGVTGADVVTSRYLVRCVWTEEAT